MQMARPYLLRPCYQVPSTIGTVNGVHRVYDHQPFEALKTKILYSTFMWHLILDEDVFGVWFCSFGYIYIFLKCCKTLGALFKTLYYMFVQYTSVRFCKEYCLYFLSWLYTVGWDTGIGIFKFKPIMYHVSRKYDFEWKKSRVYQFIMWNSLKHPFRQNFTF